jgi:catechol 2,3-dioxygenase-like lactoylglutathione lyase family enzyme
MKYLGPLIVVEEIAPARKFYEELLGQRVQMDFGVNVSFEGNLAIHQRAHYQSLLGDQFPIARKTHNFELYFETEDLVETDRRLKEAGIRYVHETCEQPWGQRVMRVYDPDDHIVEIGETMEAVCIRFHQQGMTAEQVSQRTGMPVEFVQHALQAENKPPESIRKLAGANMDIDLATPTDQISWKQDQCPWNAAENRNTHHCADKNVSLCPYFRGVEYVDTLLCCYPQEQNT